MKKFLTQKKIHAGVEITTGHRSWATKYLWWLTNFLWFQNFVRSSFLSIQPYFPWIINSSSKVKLLCNKGHFLFSEISACKVFLLANFASPVYLLRILGEKIVVELALLLWAEFLRDSSQPVKKLRNLNKHHLIINSYR